MVFPVAIDRFCTGGRFRSSQQRADSLTVTSLLVRFSFSLSSVDVKGRPDAMVDVDKQTPCIVLDFKLVRPAACRFPVSFYVTVWTLRYAHITKIAYNFFNVTIVFESLEGSASNPGNDSFQNLRRILFESWSPVKDSYRTNIVKDSARILCSTPFKSYSRFYSNPVQDTARILFRILVKFCSEFRSNPFQDFARIIF